MRSGMLGHMANLPTNGVNGHLPGDALAAGRLPGEFFYVNQQLMGNIPAEVGDVTLSPVRPDMQLDSDLNKVPERKHMLHFHNLHKNPKYHLYCIVIE